MGIAADLGYVIPRPHAAQRLVQSVASTRPGAAFFARVAPPLDDLVGRLSSGRTSAPALLAGLPVVDITTTGRRSGAPRRTHLIAVPYAGTLALLGTNFGQAATPAWVLNLEADPRLQVTYRGHTVEAVARAATDAERSAVLAGSASVYGGYLKYQTRITRRHVRIFLLEAPSPAESAPDD